MSLNSVICGWLEGDSAITALTGTRIYGGVPKEDTPDVNMGDTIIYWRSRLTTERSLTQARLTWVADYIIFAASETFDGAEALSDAIITRMFAGIKQTTGGMRIENVELIDAPYEAQYAAEGLHLVRNEFRISLI